jgi:hypothetical protein
MLEATTELRQRTVKSKGHTYEQIFIFIPRDIAKDSQFPFKPGEQIKVRIEGQRIIIEKV